MNGHPNPPRPASLVGIFVTIFLLVFMVIVVAVTFLTFLLPEAFVSEARLKLVEKNPTASQTATSAVQAFDTNLAASEAESIMSEVVLSEVVELSDLNNLWGKKFAGGQKLKTSESFAILRGRLDVRQVRNTSLISVRVFSEDREEAARLANAVVRAYVGKAAQISPQITVLVMDAAQPGLRPVRPNKPLNIALGIIAGTALGAGCAALVTALAANYRTKRRLAVPPHIGLKSIY